MVRRLLQPGARVVALVRDGVPASMLTRDNMLSRVTVIHGSVEDAGLMLRACTEYEIDTVLHLAAQPVRLVFLLLSPQEQPAEHPRGMETLVRRIQERRGN